MHKCTHHSVPVKLTNGTFLEMLLGTSNIMALGQILNHLLSGPTTREKLSLRLRETPLDIGHKAVVSARSPELIRVLEVIGLVGSALTRGQVSKREF
jgi:hypothetical protein